jgi:hypothetical protein
LPEGELHAPQQRRFGLCQALTRGIETKLLGEEHAVEVGVLTDDLAVAYPDGEVLIARIQARKAASASTLPRDRILVYREEGRR